MRQPSIIFGLACANVLLAALPVFSVLAGSTGAPVRPLQWIDWVPKAYMLEVMALSLLIAFVVRPASVHRPRALGVAWACAGALATLSALGAWTVGAALAPGLAMALLALSIATHRTGASRRGMAMWCLAGALVQGGLMAAAIGAVTARS